MASDRRKPLEGEGVVNSSGTRSEGQARTLEPATHTLLERDKWIFRHHPSNDAAIDRERPQERREPTG